MNAEELEAFALSLPGARADRPFEEDFETTVFRHAENNKWFGIVLDAPARIFGREGIARVLNLKCPPDLAEIFRARYRSVAPAYHMNKRLWISVEIPGDVSDDDLKRLIAMSYKLTERKRKK